MKKYLLRRIGVASNASPTLPSLSDCIELVLGQSDALASDVLEALKAFVTPKPGAPARDDGNDDVLPTVAQLLAQSEAVRATFGAELRRLAYQSGSQDFAQSPLGRVEDIHVFDVRALEAHIELALARQEILRAVDEVLPLFDALVAALLGWSTVQPGLNPLKPEAFVRALNETLDAWVPDEALRTTLLRPAAMALGLGLQQIYREAGDWLRSQGVEPVEPPMGKALDGAAARSTPAGTEVERTMVALDKLRRLLNGESPLSAIGNGMNDFTHTVPASFVALQDLKLVQPMMKHLSERPVQAPESAATPRRTPVAHLVRTQAQNQQIGRQLGEEVARFMLGQLVQDERLLVPLRTQLRALEPVLVQLAKKDPRFFIDRLHPARQFLDRVVQRSLVVAGEDEEGVAGFVACVANAVNLLCRGPADAGLFASVLEGLEEDLAAFAAMRRRMQEEARNARAHSEQRMVLAQRYSEVMAERFRSADLPELVAGFLRGPWSQVLAEARLAADPALPDPGAYLALVDDLVWSVQPLTAARDYARLVRLIPRLLGQLGAGLISIRYSREPVSIFLDELSALHEKAFEDHRRALAAGRAAAAALIEAREQDQIDTVADFAAPEGDAGLPPGHIETGAAGEEGEAGEAGEESDAVRPGLRSRARLLAAATPGSVPLQEVVVGSQVELLLDGAWVRAELTWTSQNRNLFMFVSGAGLAHAMSRRTMDRLQAQNRIRSVAPALEIDFELESVRGALGAR